MAHAIQKRIEFTCIGWCMLRWNGSCYIRTANIRWWNVWPIQIWMLLHGMRLRSAVAGRCHWLWRWWCIGRYVALIGWWLPLTLLLMLQSLLCVLPCTEFGRFQLLQMELLALSDQLLALILETFTFALHCRFQLFEMTQFDFLRSN